MSYLMTMLLLFFPPYKAFKYFCNLVLTKKFLYKTYLFKKKPEELFSNQNPYVQLALSTLQSVENTLIFIANSPNFEDLMSKKSYIGLVIVGTNLLSQMTREPDF